ncbi:methylated-DNA--[protein]-cysteine S-methyltransferase [Gordonia desulfuricans]|uniref:Methylated-DNA--[protein]-cysteine S-methyltransferase n=1 Tax=Gordonia desulfuricans TaxID=89051 RepID=A0A7K3LKA3_9ACTN|nr:MULTISPECIES: methylated-DNA--[protein]-cysteine S-methyltransferase [Gordonia]NDK87977.1 methylated-DNA--[protein]-cysteine S-methyltransferase [Gordonia desulfuricans]WLP89967.1 methylated-DNA--[protein]-cysteine S-methyltransferase [Gordonia sp. NB41Y]
MTDPHTTDATDVAVWATVVTPDGAFTVIADDAATVLASGWTDEPEYLLALVNRALRPSDLRRSDSLGPIVAAVEAYYDGDFDAPAAIPVTQKSGPVLEKNWAALRTVPAGAPITYTALAELAGEPQAIRAAASSCSRNAAALFVPCHRVQRFDGSLGGFRYGLPIKQSLLARESVRAK